MPDASLPELTLNNIADFHRQLLRLHAAGLRVQLDDGTPVSPGLTAQGLSDRLNEIMAGLAGQVGLSQSLSELVRGASFIPDRYRLALETWHQCDGSAESLAMLRAPVQQSSERQADLCYALLLPSIVVTLIYCASFYLLLVTVPRMEAIYAQLDSSPSQAVRWLLHIRDAMPYWGPGIPLLFGLVWYMLIAGRWSLPGWLFSRWRSSQYLASSLVARNLAARIDQTHAPETTGCAPTGDWPAPGLSQLPMMRWALSSNTDVQTAVTPETPANMAQRSRRLRLAANLYETMQTIHAQRLRMGLTLFVCIVLGGGMTLMYALALFAPLVELLNHIVGR